MSISLVVEWMFPLEGNRQVRIHCTGVTCVGDVHFAHALWVIFILTMHCSPGPGASLLFGVWLWPLLFWHLVMLARSVSM